VAETEARERAIWDALDVAVRAAQAGDALAEERAIQAGLQIAETFRPSSFMEGWRAAGRGGLGEKEVEFNNRLTALLAEGKLRRQKYFGSVGDYHFWGDRILAADRSVYLMDENVRATVDTAGSISISRRPTLTRMAAGSILPGSALIPGFALAKKETFDSRELYFLLEHPAGAAVIQVDPQYGHVTRQVAAGINAAAAQIGRAKRRQAGDPHESGSTKHDDRTAVLAQLEKLGELLERNILTDDEFQTEKARILGDSPQLPPGPRVNDEFKIVVLQPGGLTVEAVFPPGLSFEPEDLALLTDARAQFEEELAGSPSAFERAASLLAAYNTARYLRVAVEEAKGTGGLRFRADADQAALAGWLDAIRASENELSGQTTEAFNALSSREGQAAIAATEVKMAPVLSRIPGLLERARGQLEAQQT
jgi:Short C-terminal domain